MLRTADKDNQSFKVSDFESQKLVVELNPDGSSEIPQWTVPCPRQEFMNYPMKYHLVHLLDQPDDVTKEHLCELSTAQKFISQKNVAASSQQSEQRGTSSLQIQSGLFRFLQEAAELHKTRHIPFLNKPEAINALDSILHASMQFKLQA